MRKSNAFKESFIFLKRWCAHPFQLGALFPSSRFLAFFMAKEALKRMDEGDYILELGPGTGRFTRALLEAGISPDRIIGVEIDTRLIGYLQDQFPDIQFIQGNACHLTHLIPPHVQGRIGVIISGLPMLGFCRTVQKEIVDNCFSILKKGGNLLQFTYGLSSSLDSPSFGIHQNRLGWVLRNIPPACIWSYEKDVS